MKQKNILFGLFLIVALFILVPQVSAQNSGTLEAYIGPSMTVELLNGSFSTELSVGNNTINEGTNIHVISNTPFELWVSTEEPYMKTIDGFYTLSTPLNIQVDGAPFFQVFTPVKVYSADFGDTTQTVKFEQYVSPIDHFGTYSINYVFDIQAV